MELTLTAPVLLIAFNRPDTTETVFSRIRDAKPSKLYVAVDGARNFKKGEDLLVQQVKNIVQNVDWNCEVYYNFHEKNLGAEINVSSSIKWVFDNEEFVIVLEDDIVAPKSFFKFAQDMLIKYKHVSQIGTISGSNFTPIPLNNDTDYFFAKYGHSWGWATWKREWENFDLFATIPDRHLEAEFLRSITNSKTEAKYYSNLFKKIRKNGPGQSTWDYIGLYFHRINNKLSVIPKVNLTSNIGVYGLHAKGKTEHHFRSFDENFVVKTHPQKVDCNLEFDIHHFQTYINPNQSILKRIYKKMRKKIL